MKTAIPWMLLCLLGLTSSGLTADVGGHPVSGSPYAGLEARTIKSLSAEDRDQLLNGEGWGFALAAELNGFPGPAHLLELKDKIGLSADQVARITTIHSEMKAEAIAAGKRFIAAEEAIERIFTSGRLSDDRLRFLVNRSAVIRAELRFIHLSRHLQMPNILTADQIERYKVLRGYASSPCAHEPGGTDPNAVHRHGHCN